MIEDLFESGFHNLQRIVESAGELGRESRRPDSLESTRAHPQLAFGPAAGGGRRRYVSGDSASSARRAVSTQGRSSGSQSFHKSMKRLY